jgi:monooxygenase
LQNNVEHFDVVIVGAGLSGVGAGYYLQTAAPTRSYVILESREGMGGTWDLFRYPGVRSDSDMYTLGFRFRPWPEGKAIADGPSILKYIKETARAFGIDHNIRYQHRAVGAEWSSQTSTWLVDVETGPEKECKRFACNFLYLCTGYYDYESGYTPEWPDFATFRGSVIHPQKWPRDFDYTNKRVVVIGSGATAVTVVPAMTDKAAHVTMLQRSPTYIMARPSQDPIANWMPKWLPNKIAYAATRWKNVLVGMAFFGLSRKRPDTIRRYLMNAVRRELPNYNVDKHFNPKYNPWDERLCLVPDADLFRAIREGRASIVTDHIKRFTKSGIELQSGEYLDADVIVTATGLVVKPAGGMRIVVDGRQVHLHDLMTYKGMMFSDVPNMAVALGYTNASWTLKCELTSEYVCRLLNYMERKRFSQCIPRRRDPSIKAEPILNFTSGYVQRALPSLPSQGSKRPWRLYQNYALDLVTMRYGRINDGTMEFKRSVTS